MVGEGLRLDGFVARAWERAIEGVPELAAPTDQVVRRMEAELQRLWEEARGPGLSDLDRDVSDGVGMLFGEVALRRRQVCGASGLFVRMALFLREAVGGVVDPGEPGVSSDDVLVGASGTYLTAPGMFAAVVADSGWPEYVNWEVILRLCGILVLCEISPEQRQRFGVLADGMRQRREPLAELRALFSETLVGG